MEGKHQRGPRRRGNRNRRRSRDRNGKKVDGCFVEDGEPPRNENLIAELKEYFSKHKPLLLLMDYHTINVIVKGKSPTYKCQTCNSTMASHLEIEEHINKKMSHRNYLDSDRLRLVASKLSPTLPVVEKLEKFLIEEIVSSRFTHESFVQRRSIFHRIETLVVKTLPAAKLEIVGSTYHGLGLNNCDLNMSLYIDDKSIFNALHKLASQLEQNENCRQFKRWFADERRPAALYFVWKGVIPCQILILNEHSHKLAKLLNEYGKIDERCRQLCILFRKWASLCQIDSLTDGSWPSHVIYLLVIFFLQQSSPPVLPVLNQLIPTSNGAYEVYEDVTETVHALWKTSNTDSLANLWIKLLTFYCHQFDASNNVVCITRSQPFLRTGNWSGKRLCVIDPYEPERNLTRTVCNSTMYDYIMHCLKTTCVYFTIPQFAEGPIFGNIHPDPIIDETLNVPGYEEFVDVQLRLSHYIVRLIPHLDTNYIVDRPNELPVILNKINSMKGLYINTCSINLDDFDKLSVRNNPKQSQYKNYSLLLRDAQYLMSRIDPNKLSYNFVARSFTSGVTVPTCCVICAKNDHTQLNCPDVVLDVMKPVVIDDELVQLVDQVCVNVYSQSIPTLNDVRKKERALYYLQNYVFYLFNDAKLALFGSSQNGFGLRNSDMDICLTFHKCPSSDGLPKNTLSLLFQHLKKNPEFKNLILIQNAKVPIIKFLHAPTNLEGDISLYNILAQENTKLLRTYSEIDRRVKILGYMVKRLAKTCNVGDASKGSLSSYCYMLMMIYFLQRCDPPILPVLQELPSNQTPPPTRIVDGWNTYFFDHLNQLNVVWPEYGRNHKSSGELWVEFLTFYTQEFDSEHLVVSIRTSSMVYKLEKRWFWRTLAIEDPFVLDRNLGSGLSIRMHYFILKAFGKARNVFTTKFKPNKNVPIDKIYFDKKLLAKYDPPFDRGCLACKSIGHKVAQCPEVKFQKDRLWDRWKGLSLKEKQAELIEMKRPSSAVVQETPKGVPPNKPTTSKTLQWTPSSKSPGPSPQTNDSAPSNRPTLVYNNPKFFAAAPVDPLHQSSKFYEGAPLLQTQVAQSYAYQSIVNQLKLSNRASSKKKPFK